MTHLLSVDEALQLHEAALLSYGGPGGIRDKASLESALALPLSTFGGQELYPTLMDKVAAMGHSLIQNHPFIDGNKRVGFAAMAVVLLENQLQVVAHVDDAVEMTLSVASGQMDREQVRDWLTNHVVRLSEVP